MSEKRSSAVNAAGVDMSSLLNSKAYGEQLKALEESDRQSILARDRASERITELGGEVQKANDGVGEIRGLLGALRGSVEKISPLFDGYVKKADMPCTRSEWESMKKAMKELQTATDRAAFQAHGTAAAETATYKAELAEMQVTQLDLQKQMREMQKTMKARDEEIRKLIAAAPQSPKVQHGASAMALLELGKKRTVEPTPEPVVEEVKPVAAAPAPAPVVAAVPIAPAPAPIAAAATEPAKPAIDHSPVLEALTRELQSLSSQCTAMNTELARSRAESKQFQNELSTLRSGFANVHASMPVPFVAPSTLPQSALPQATMIAVSLVCDVCNEKNAVVFCVHCPSNSQKLCETCDASVHAPAPGQPPIATNQTVGNAGKSVFATPTPSEIKVPASSQAASAASKHLRLEISRAIQPGSKLMSSDLGFVKNQQENHAVSVVREGHMNLQKEMSDLMERVDRHDLQFSSLAVSLNSLDEAEAKLATMDREVKAVRIKLAEQERLLKVTKEDHEEMNSKLETIAASPALNSRHIGGSPIVSEDGSKASPPALPRKLSAFAKQENTNPMTAALAQQLHSELDAHRRQTEHAFLELVGKLETLQTVELDSLSQSIRALDKSKIDRSALLNQNEKLIAIESQLRSLVNSQGFASRKFSDHLDTWRESLSAWTCQHCNSNALAFGGNCAEKDCKLRICWDCSRVASSGHVSELVANGSFGGGGGASLTQLQAVLDTTPAFQELQLKLRNVIHTTERQGVLLEIEGQQLHQMLELLNKMRLIVPGAAPTPEEKQLAHMKGLPVSNLTSTLSLGPSSALLLDSRTLSYFESLQDLFQHSLPDILTKLMMLEKSNETNTTNLLHMDRWKREFDVASRPYVDDKFSQVALQLNLAEKAMKKAWKSEWKRYEIDFRATLQKEKIEEREKAGLDSSIARVHYRCVACDQLVLNQTGPLGKEFSHPQFAVHLHQQHLTHLQQQQLLPAHLQHTTHVGGFASPAPLASGMNNTNSFHGTNYLPPATSSKVGTGSLDLYPDRLQNDYKEPSSSPATAVLPAASIGSMTTPTPNRNNMGSRGGGRKGAAMHSTPSQPPINALPQLAFAASASSNNNTATPLPPRPPTVGSQSARRASKDLLDS